ncbi:MAG: glycosyltransferase family 2 protein [Burkholderiales bacterium]
MRAAVVITTYNRPDALAAVLEGYIAQGDRDFDLVVADDGSTADTQRMIEAFRPRAPMPVLHVWQEDRGFRAAAARNRAVAATAAEYVIFTDGDCVPSRGFVAAHKRLAQRGRFLAGNRILLSEAFTQRVLATRMPIHEWGWLQWAGAWARRDVNRLLPLLQLPDGDFRLRRPWRWEGVKTCNLSLWRDDFLRVNGLDESYEGWGLEDSDLVIRLQHADVKHKNARFATPVFHLWHRENPRDNLARNLARLDEVLASGQVRATQGVEQYL